MSISTSSPHDFAPYLAISQTIIETLMAARDDSKSIVVINATEHLLPVIHEYFDPTERDFEYVGQAIAYVLREYKLRNDVAFVLVLASYLAMALDEAPRKPVHGMVP